MSPVLQGLYARKAVLFERFRGCWIEREIGYQRDGLEEEVETLALQLDQVSEQIRAYETSLQKVSVKSA